MKTPSPYPFPRGWVTEDGAEFYTDDEYADANMTSLLNRTDWKRTPIRPRRPL